MVNGKVENLSLIPGFGNETYRLKTKEIDGQSATTKRRRDGHGEASDVRHEVPQEFR